MKKYNKILKNYVIVLMVIFMLEKYEIEIIGYIYNVYKEIFGIPRQSGQTKKVIS